MIPLEWIYSIAKITSQIYNLAKDRFNTQCTFNNSLKVNTTLSNQSSDLILVVTDADLNTQFLTQKGTVGSPYSIYLKIFDTNFQLKSVLSSSLNLTLQSQYQIFLGQTYSDTISYRIPPGPQSSYTLTFVPNQPGIYYLSSPFISRSHFKIDISAQS